jgi:guanylate kinase
MSCMSAKSTAAAIPEDPKKMSSTPALISKLPLVLCGPSGVGKSTLIKRLKEDFPGAFGFSVSHTTRSPRAGEVDGKDYNFVTDKAVMEADIAAGKFLESANVHGNFYGTSWAAIESVKAAGQICILDIDVQGVASCRKAGFPVGFYVFIAPPEMSVLEQRLRGRGTETEESIAKRVGGAQKEIMSATATSWDAWIVNDDLDKAYAQLKALVTGTKMS